MSDAYQVDDGADDFCMLHGPDDFCCRLGEPEDRIWIRDGREAVDRLNEQHAEIERLTGCLAKANSNHEDFERRWYLAVDDAQAALAEVERLRLALSNAAMAIDHCAEVTDVGSEPSREAVLMVGFELRSAHGQIVAALASNRAEQAGKEVGDGDS